MKEVDVGCKDEKKMMKAKKVNFGKALIFAFIISTLAFVTVGCASAATHYVYSDESIQAAVDAASFGDTVFVYNGTYFENVVVDKSLILTGEDKNTTIIYGDGSRAGVSINAGNCVISGFTVKNGINGIHLSPSTSEDTTRTLTQNETWSGVKLINGTIIVPEGVTLNIEPGTVIKFKHYRGYKEQGKRLGLIISGTLNSTGTPENPIWFTSDAEEPINGDWVGIVIENSNEENIIKYSIVEYAFIGIRFWTSSGTVADSIVRWITAEGIYMERSNPVIENNTIYGTGFNGIAMEQFNEVIIRNNKIINNQGSGIHGEATEALIENNLINNSKTGITFNDFSNVTLRNNLIEHISSEGLIVYLNSTGNLSFNKIRNNGIGISSSGSELIANNNDIYNNTINIELRSMQEVNIKENWWGTTNKSNITKKIHSDTEISFEPFLSEESVDFQEPVFDYQDVKKTELGYIPGDPEDKYPYVYADEDETRRVVKKICGDEEGFSQYGFGWSLAWDGEYLWRTKHAGAGDFVKVNPETGEIVASLGDHGIAQDRGVAFDGQHLWVNDFTKKEVFEIDPETDKIISSFTIPEMGSGSSGIAWDGQYLYLVNWLNLNELYKVDKQGNLIDIIELERPGGASITFDGQYFWISPSGRGIRKFDKQGKLVGEIYAAAFGGEAIAHDGNYLWVLHRTQELWNDPKLYKIEVLNDALQSISNNTITDNIISYNTWTGIFVDNSNNNTISRNSVSHNGYRGILIQASQNSGVYGNTVSFSGDRGIVLEGGRNNTVHNNIVHDNAACGSIDVIRSTNNMIHNNTAYLNEWGIATNNASNNQIQNNTIYSNNLGIHLDWSSSDNNILSNDITDCNQGIALRNTATNNKIANNAISNNNHGIFVESSYSNLFYHNSLINNTHQAYDNGANSWDNGAEGNYWSDYEEKYPDANEIDGIWDTPYEIPVGDNQDNYPLVGPYTGIKIFDTEASANPYPSISGTHNGTITLNQTITVSKLYTYPCAGTGGHTEYVRIWNSSDWNVTASWDDYKGDWHNISFDEPFTLQAGVEYNYTLKTGSYPQIHHTPALPTANGWINCTEFTDANGKKYTDWIPAIKLFEGVFQISDAHAHLFFGQPDFVDGLVAAMDEEGVRMSVLFGDCYQPYPDYQEGIFDDYNNRIIEAWQKYPDRFWPILAGFDPQHNSSPSYIREQLATGKWKGIGELYLLHESLPEHGTRADHPVAQEIWRAAAEFNVPVFIHYERWDDEAVSALYSVLETNPNTTFIWLHIGHHEDINQLGSELEHFPNLFIEFEMVWSEADPVYPAFIDLLECYPDRFLMGTDIGCMDELLTPYNASYADAVSAQKTLLARLSPSTARAVGYENIETLMSGNTTPPVILHTQITTAIKGSPIPISAIITDDTGVASATLFYRIMGKEAWKSASKLLIGDNNYSATIPASNVTIAGVEYYIVAMDAAPNTAYKPETAPMVPYSITVITDWNPWDDDGIITTEEIQEAAYCWITDTPKNGHTITTEEIQELVSMWLTS